MKRSRSKSVKKSSSNSSKKERNKSVSDKSRSRSSSKNKFYFKQNSAFLTYPHTENKEISKKELGDFLFDTFDCEITVICEEHHKDGGLHLHAWIELKNELYTRDCHIFDFNGCHCHIGKMKDGKKNTRANVLNYMTKEDKELLYYFYIII